MSYVAAQPRPASARRPASGSGATWATPAQLADARLSRRERLRLLHDWAQALADHDLQAGSRGLPLPSDQKLVGEIAAAIAAVHAEPAGARRRPGLIDRLLGR